MRTDRGSPPVADFPMKGTTVWLGGMWPGVAKRLRCVFSGCAALEIFFDAATDSAECEGADGCLDPREAWSLGPFLLMCLSPVLRSGIVIYVSSALIIIAINEDISMCCRINNNQQSSINKGLADPKKANNNYTERDK